MIAAIRHPELGDATFLRTHRRFAPGTGWAVAAHHDRADAPIFKASSPGAETEGRALELSPGGRWHRADGSGLVTRC